MYKRVFITILILASLGSALVKCTSAGGRNKANFDAYGRRIYYGGKNSQTIEEPVRSITPKEFLDENSGFSTFGIISIIFSIIVVCLAFYYAFLCYPLLCRDEKRYRYMSDISSTTTAVTSRSMQSIQHCNYSNDEKH